MFALIPDQIDKILDSVVFAGSFQNQVENSVSLTPDLDKKMTSSAAHLFILVLIENY